MFCCMSSCQAIIHRDSSLLGFDAAPTGKYSPTFRRGVGLPSSGSKVKRYVPPRHQWPTAVYVCLIIYNYVVYSNNEAFTSLTIYGLLMFKYPVRTAQ